MMVAQNTVLVMWLFTFDADDGEISDRLYNDFCIEWMSDGHTVPDSVMEIKMTNKYYVLAALTIMAMQKRASDLTLQK